MSQDIVRVLRIIEYTGPREFVEKLVAQSIHGERIFGPAPGHRVTVRAATIGTYPEILNAADAPAIVGQFVPPTTGGVP